MVEVVGGSTVVLDFQFNGSKRELLLRAAVNWSEDDWRVLVFLRGEGRVLLATHPNLIVLLDDLVFGAVLCGRDDEGIVWAIFDISLFRRMDSSLGKGRVEHLDALSFYSRFTAWNPVHNSLCSSYVTCTLISCLYPTRAFLIFKTDFIASSHILFIFGRYKKGTNK
jgi:hypothetical protein